MPRGNYGRGCGKPVQKRRILAAALVLSPLVLIICSFIEGGWRIAATIIAFLSMLPFYMLFERRKPKAREIVPVAVMSALAAISRMAFVFAPQFKPIIAIVIITAVVFGAESGFLCGTCSMLVSKFFFGHGPHTPWQMFCCGLIGYAAGVLSRKKIITGKLGLCIFGLISGFIFGAIVDIWTVIGTTPEITPQTVAAIYIAGLPFNAALAAATAFFLYVASVPMIQKLERIKQKFGLYDKV